MNAQRYREVPCSGSLAEHFQGFSPALAAAYHDLGLQSAYTPEHCTNLERLFLQMQCAIQMHIDLLEQPYVQQDIVWRLRRLHRDLIEACVVVRGVCGLCATKRHLAEPTGSFWQLTGYVRSLRQQCQAIAIFFTRNTNLDRVVSAREALSA